MKDQFNLNTVLSTICAAMLMWMVKTTNDNKQAFEVYRVTTDAKLEVIRTKIDSDSSWKISYQHAWAKDLAQSNPGLKVPSVRETINENK